MPSADTHPFFQHPDLPRGVPLAFAHRGFSPQGLENSMAAFAAAVDLGYRYLETDVHATADGVLVAFHDHTLARVTDATGVIETLPWRVVRRARIGGVEPIPTLEDLLGAWPHVHVNIDIKAAAAIAPLVDVIERTRSHDRVCVTSFSDARRRAATRRLTRPVAQAPGRTGIALFRAGVLAGRSALARRALNDVHCLQVPERTPRLRLVTPATVRATHLAGRQIHVWTINDAPTMTRLLDMGVDGIITDRSDVLRDVLRARGQWVDVH